MLPPAGFADILRADNANCADRVEILRADRMGRAYGAAALRADRSGACRIDNAKCQFQNSRIFGRAFNRAQLSVKCALAAGLRHRIDDRASRGWFNSQLDDRACGDRPILGLGT